MRDSLSPLKQSSNWAEFYSRKRLVARYPTEWVIRTLAGGNYPGLKMDKNSYAGARILDMGCGDGRNLPLLLDLGFEVHATEITSDIVASLQVLAGKYDLPVTFKVGVNACLPYPDQYFDYMLCCANCYYLEGNMTWSGVRKELARVIKPGGLMIANFPDDQTAILNESIRQADGSQLITNDPFNLRNGTRFMAVTEKADLEPFLAPEFRLIGSGHQVDDFYGLRVSVFMTVSERL